MSQYHQLASAYDALTRDVNYTAFADYIEWQFSRKIGGVKLALDLCCGTGTLTHLLAERGYEMMGIDASVDMLAEASSKDTDALVPPVFLCQSMERLDLYGTIDACISTLDSINYITDPSLLQAGFERIHLFLEPGGLFLFDINRPETLQSMDGQLYLDETEDTYCVWQGSFQDGLLRFDMDLFRQEGKHWRRYEEQHFQRAYQPQVLEQMLRQAGFVTVEQFGTLKKETASETDSRVFLAAWKDLAWKPKTN